MERIVRLVRVAAALLALVAGTAGYAPSDAVAQEESPLAAMGYPELRITITDTGFEAPAEVASGLVLLTVENATTGTEEAIGANLLLPPAGTTPAEVAAFFGPPEGTPAADEELMAPAWIYETTAVGGPLVLPGQTGQAVVNLTPGEWLVVNDSPGAAQQPQSLTVTEAASPVTEEPAADVDVTLQEYAFVGLEQGLPAGPHVWRVTNAGEQPHIIVLFRGPDEITIDQIMTLFQMEEDATPTPDMGFQEADFDFNQPGMGALSAGQTNWLEIDLEPGTYVAICFVPDREMGIPHALMGMIQVFTVGEGGAAAATPAAGGAAPAGEASALTIANFAFDPAALEVAAGTTVTWTNQDAAPHTATEDNGLFDSGRLDQGGAFSHTFDTAGTYAYHCDFHPNMTGTVTVT